MKKVLVTGATGFLGYSALKVLLAKSFEVVAVDHVRSAPRQAGVKWYTADLLEPGTPERLIRDTKPSHLLHFAWYMRPEDYRQSPDNLSWCSASVDLIRHFALYGGLRAVLCGTCFEYDDRYGFCSEKLTPIRPGSLYGICKNSLRQMALAFAEHSQLSMAWGRAFFLYGPWEAQKRLVPNVIVNLLRNLPANCSHGEQIRDFLHVEDGASAFVALLESKVCGEVNIASGVPLKLKDIIWRIADELDARELINLGAIGTLPTEPPVLLADVRRLRDEVGWQPRFSVDEGLRQTIQWWRSALSISS